MDATSFVHLHLHTHYSLLDGATRIGALIDRAKEFNMPAVAITDHGNMFGAIEFYNAARAAGIKPIIGCEAYLTPGHRTEKIKKVNEKEAFHLLLLAMNLEGYQNLLKLSSIGYTEGFYRKPRIDKEVLAEYSAGLICTSTCIGGEIPQALMGDNRAKAEELAESYLKIFGDKRFFVELQDHNMPEQKNLNPELIDLANRLGVGLIATNDVHYLDHDDVEAHDVLCCINTNARLDEEERFRFPTDQFYFKNTEEMVALFENQPEAISNTLLVADMCNLELDLTKRHAPVYRVPAEITDDKGKSLDDAAYLRKLVYDGAAERYPEIDDALRERIDYELEVITSKGFSSYFLIMWDCVRYARQEGIPAGARGSGCSSVVAYCLYLSAPDPIRYGLYFERFMDPDRDEMPDIDLDICQNGRGQLIDYVRQKYGHVAQIITFGTLKAKAVVKDVSRVVGLEFEEANQLTKLIPSDLHMTLDKALEQEPELKKRYNEDERVKRIIDIGRRLEGVARNAGIHAAGVVVADEPLQNFLPLYKQAGQDALITQYDGPTTEKVGMLKMDFLGLRTLSTLERARQLAQRSTDTEIDLESLDLTDPKVYELFARGDTKGIFQFESGGMRDVIMRMKPNRIEDLIAANALYRPGPMEYIPEYVARKHGQAWTTPHPIMTEVLSETYGVMVYQEQVSRVVNRLGGIELKTAFRLAKAISKKKTSMIEAMREPFLDGCEGNGVDRKVANDVFEDILKFGGYAFNKAHSTGYAIVAFRTAWMKTYYPVEFMAALMTFEMGSTDKVAEYREACTGMGIDVRPPNINQSELDFLAEISVSSSKTASSDTPAAPSNAPASASATGSKTTVPGNIRFGLGAIKGVGTKAVEAIVHERKENGQYRSLFDFCERVDLSAVNRAATEALICAGAFDSTGAMRKSLIDVLDDAISAGQRLQQDHRSGQMGLFSEAPPGDAAAGPEPILLASEWSEAEMLAREKAVLGFYITKHPLASHERLLASCVTASTVDLGRYEDGAEVVIGGMVSHVRTVTTKSGKNAGKRLAIVTLEDLKGKVEAVVFPRDFDTFRQILVPDAIVFMQGEVDRKREEASLRVKEVVEHGGVIQAFAKAVILTIKTEEQVADVVALLRNHRGNVEVYLDVPTDHEAIAQIQCGAGMRVDCSRAFIRHMVRAIGEESVTILGNRRLPLPFAEFIAQTAVPSSPPPAPEPQPV